MLKNESSIKMSRQVECHIRFSVLNSKVDTNNIGRHDFVESCHTIYTNLKKCILDWALDDIIDSDDFYLISGCVDVFYKYSLMPFLTNYHYKLWRRHNVPRKIFYSAGKEWAEDVENLKRAASKLMEDLNEVNSEVSEDDVYSVLDKLILLKYKLGVEFSEEAWVEWNHASEIIDEILSDVDWDQYEGWEDDVNLNAVKNLSENI